MSHNVKRFILATRYILERHPHFILRINSNAFQASNNDHYNLNTKSVWNMCVFPQSQHENVP